MQPVRPQNTVADSSDSTEATMTCPTTVPSSSATHAACSWSRTSKSSTGNGSGKR